MFNCVEKIPVIQFEHFENKLTKMDKNTNSGLSDETVDQFGEFMKMIEEFYQDLFEIETDDTIYRFSPH